MSAGFGDDFKERVRASTNLVDLISETVSLIPSGRDYRGLCPFHDDRNPSFHVYPDRQTYRCWVCDLGGDCFTWVQETEKVSFPEAVRILAERARLDLPPNWKSRRDAGTGTAGKTDLIAVVDWAVRLMHQSLRSSPEGERARRYLKERNISDATIQTFRLGYHPENWSWLLDRCQGQFTEKQLVEVSLAGERSVVVVEHDMEFVRNIARNGKVTVLHEGRVLAEGPMSAIQNDPGVIEVYLGG